ncbi:MAG: TetR/AcrR family transcriptional regulator [Butyrivibrio sp.]|nr:TetR/AcrR family transcriptional regulator [Butyrivibrio sp.]
MSLSEEQKEDLRIQKTRKKLKGALTRLLSECVFSDISVRQICQAAGITTITFYTYYSDKYALAKELYREVAVSVKQEFQKREKENNKNGDLLESCCNILECLISLFGKENSPLARVYIKNGLYLYQALSDIIMKEISEFFQKNNLKTIYSLNMVSAFFCNGIWGYFAEGKKEGKPIEQVRKEAREFLCTILQSDFFENRG